MISSTVLLSIISHWRQDDFCYLVIMSPLMSDTRVDELPVDELLEKLIVDEKVALLAGMLHG